MAHITLKTENQMDKNIGNETERNVETPANIGVHRNNHLYCGLVYIYIYAYAVLQDMGTHSGDTHGFVYCGLW